MITWQPCPSGFFFFFFPFFFFPESGKAGSSGGAAGCGQGFSSAFGACHPRPDEDALRPDRMLPDPFSLSLPDPFFFTLFLSSARAQPGTTRMCSRAIACQSPVL